MYQAVIPEDPTGPDPTGPIEMPEDPKAPPPDNDPNYFPGDEPVPDLPTEGEPETPEDNPPGTLEEVAPTDPKDPLPADDAAETGIPTKEPSPDTTPS